MNQLQENEPNNEGREMEGMEFLEESPLESIKKFNIELESEESEPKGSDDMIELYFRKMSPFPLLKRDEELEVSKHIEMKPHQLIEEFVNSPLVLGYIMDLKEGLEYGELHAHRLVTGVDEQSQLVADEKTAESILRRALKQVKKKINQSPTFFFDREDPAPGTGWNLATQMQIPKKSIAQLLLQFESDRGILQTDLFPFELHPAGEQAQQSTPQKVRDEPKGMGGRTTGHSVTIKN